MKNLLPAIIVMQSVGLLAVGGFVALRATAANPKVAAHNRRVEAPPKAHEPKPVVLDPRAVVMELVEGNERFARGVAKHRDLLGDRRGLVEGQHPKAIVLGCSDSRVPPELVFDETLGALFVVRSAGNVADKIGLASMEYAVEHLHAPVLLVLGHEKCGAVTAAASGDKMPSENLQALADEIAPGLAKLKASYKGPELVHYGVEANVTATANEVIDRSVVLRKAVEEGHLAIVRAIYDLGSGRVRWLEADAPAVGAAPSEAEEPSPEGQAPAAAATKGRAITTAAAPKHGADEQTEAPKKAETAHGAAPEKKAAGKEGAAEKAPPGGAAHSGEGPHK